MIPQVSSLVKAPKSIQSHIELSDKVPASNQPSTFEKDNQSAKLYVTLR